MTERIEVTREALIAALQDQEPVFAVIEMLDKTGSYASGSLRDPDDTADSLLKHMAGQRIAAERFAAAADPELAAMAAVVAALAPLEQRTQVRVLAWAHERYRCDEPF